METLIKTETGHIQVRYHTGTSDVTINILHEGVESSIVLTSAEQAELIGDLLTNKVSNFDFGTLADDSSDDYGLGKNFHFQSMVKKYSLLRSRHRKDVQNRKDIQNKIKEVKDRLLDEGAEEVQVFIALPQREIELLDRETIQNTTGDFMEAMGFELKTEDEPVYGSFFQNLWFKRSKKLVGQELGEVYGKGKQALEAQYLNVPTAEASEKLANAAANLIKALESIDEGVLRMGSLIVVKIEREGKSLILAETVSHKLMCVFEDNSNILSNPAAVYELIKGDKKMDDQIDTGDASVAV